MLKIKITYYRPLLLYTDRFQEKKNFYIAAYNGSSDRAEKKKCLGNSLSVGIY